ncbi:DUF4235 domain-containing protein [Allokutzneria sp. A3M-2-11 16]|uniref:DUF4235 domain-containing protein n=1 Tax=Allokutzneria sp. A3M-2-11 16 TaxID=2962043 RepID=UPI0020B858DA|nr:DUF4235 domain-containing protein [Allokutzneria sp. A3M-2-11 16]MCP3802094.1 DUF4235 domain-containing protein [Allokutzneria sp. A3M-2-11 16]
MKLLFTPARMLAGVLGGVAASAASGQIWKLVSGSKEAPDATDRDHSWGEVIAAAALQGAVFAVVKAAIDRGSAVAYHRATGEWPEK